jgi:hypothetical protein
MLSKATAYSPEIFAERRSLPYPDALHSAPQAQPRKGSAGHVTFYRRKKNFHFEIIFSNRKCLRRRYRA